MSEKRRRQAELLVLGALALRPVWLRAFQLYEITSLRASRLFPALDTLETRGWIEAEWFTTPDGRRRAYRLAT